MMRRAASDVVLIDVNQKRAIAEAQDSMHAVPFAAVIDVYAGDYEDLREAKVIVIAAGANQKPGETRLMLIEKECLHYERYHV